MQDETSGAVITFDGRLDNRDELQSLLKLRGFALKTGADSDLVLNAYLCWGASCCEKVLGDFAFAIWDERKRRLYCARDPIGVKPFYYHFDGEKFVFASEIHPLLRDTTIDWQPNPSFIQRFMQGDFSERTATAYRDIYTIRPAHYLTVDANGRMSSKRYWDAGLVQEIRYKTTEEYTEHFRDLFQEAVRCRLRVNGPVGALLSGGVDSSSIVCTCQKLFAGGMAPNKGFETFSVVSDVLPLSHDGDLFDERRYIQSVLHMYHLRSNYFWYENLMPSPPMIEVARRYRDVSYHPALPILAQVLGSATQKGVKVMLNGVGGDDILGADPDVYLYQYADLLRNLKIGRLVGDLRLALKYYSLPEVTGLFLRHGIRPLITELLKLHIRLQSQLTRRRHTSEPRFPSIFQKEIYRDVVQGWNTGVGLADLDKCCSYYSIEPRYPFFDVRLIKFVLAIPPEQLSRNYQTKLVLRRSMNGILPEMIRRRGRKATFDPLVKRELIQLHKEEILQLLMSPTLSCAIDWIDIRRVFNEYCKDTPSGRRHVAKLLRAIGFELWHRTMIQSKGGHNGQPCEYRR